MWIFFCAAEGIQFQLIVHGDLTDFGNIEGSQADTAGNQDRLRCFACCDLSRTFSSFKQKNQAFFASS
jgi:hypothetical protein